MRTSDVRDVVAMALMAALLIWACLHPYREARPIRVYPTMGAALHENV
jgi:hypothetical protein